MYVKFENNKVIAKTNSKEQALFYNIPFYNGELEKGYDGCEYKKGYAPIKPEHYDLKLELLILEEQYNMPRVIREGILSNPTAYSEFNVKKAKELEAIAKKIRG